MVKASTLGARFCEVCSHQNFHFRSQSHLVIHSHTSKVHPVVCVSPDKGERFCRLHLVAPAHPSRPSSRPG